MEIFSLTFILFLQAIFVVTQPPRYYYTITKGVAVKKNSHVIEYALKQPQK